jgi:hypothetical protein
MLISNDHTYWRELAEEARAIAEAMTDLQCRIAMLQIADGYERIADRAEIRAKTRTRAGVVST